MTAPEVEKRRSRLFVVDDAPEITFIVERWGHRLGHDVASRPSVAAAWDYLSHSQPDLLIVDINLLGESGLELCRRVRITPRLGGLPMAVFCHWDRPEDIAAGLEAGCKYVLSKSLLSRPDEWQRRIEELLLPGDRQPYVGSLSWTGKEQTEPVVTWVDSLNQVLRFQAPRQLGLEVVLVVVRQAMSSIAPGICDRCLLPDGLGLDGEVIMRAGTPDLVMAFAVSLAHRFWSILGSIEGAALERALASAVPPLAEFRVAQP